MAELFGKLNQQAFVDEDHHDDSQVAIQISSHASDPYFNDTALDELYYGFSHLFNDESKTNKIC